MKTRYLCVKDLQGGTFGVGRLQTLKEWRNSAIEWATSDENYAVANLLINYRIKNCDLIDYISSVWQLELKGE